MQISSRQRQNYRYLLQTDKKKEVQLLYKFLYILLVGGTSFFIHLTSYLNPVLPITRRLEGQNPVSIGMKIDHPAMAMVCGLSRSRSGTQISMHREKNFTSVTRVSPREN